MPFKDKETAKAYRESRKEQIALQRKEYRKKNKERLAKENREWRERHKQELAVKRNEYYAIHKEEINARNKEWKKNNLEKVREYTKANSRTKVLRKHGITQEQFASLLAKQNNCCAACGERFTKKLKPFVDHCHQAGHVRGLLCHWCNSAEGLLRTPNRALKLARYMESASLFCVPEKKEVA
jgi:hypothetical protein